MHHNFNIGFKSILVTVIASVLFGPSTGLATIGCPGLRTDNYTPSADISQTSNTTCITLNTAGKTIDLAGKSIICDRPAGCTIAVALGAANTTVRDGYIKNGQGQWFAGVVSSACDIPNNLTCATSVTRMTVHGAQFSVVNPGAKVQNSVIDNEGGTVQCCVCGGGIMPNSGDVMENYCLSDNVGISVAGPSSGTAATVKQNYVRAAVTGIDTSQGGTFTVTHNIVDVEQTGSNEDFITGAGTTSTENVCKSCSNPDSNFNLSMDFVP